MREMFGNLLVCIVLLSAAIIVHWRLVVAYGHNSANIPFMILVTLSVATVGTHGVGGKKAHCPSRRSQDTNNQG